MTAAGPDPYAETVRLLPADTFTYFRQTREKWIAVVADALWDYDTWPDDAVDQDDYRSLAIAVVDALLAHLAAQQARPTFGAHNQ